MIKNIPKAEDFENAGIDSICQSINFIIKIRKDTDKDYFKDKDKIWKYNQSILRTSLIILYQGMEILMKSQICKHSPYLLIEENRDKWPTLPDRSDKDFDNYYTIAGDNLLTTFFAVQENIKTDSNKKKFIQLFKELKEKRNKAMHGLFKDELTPFYIINTCITIFTIYYGKDYWLKEWFKKIKEDPIFGKDDIDNSIVLINDNMDYIAEFIGIPLLKRNFKIQGKRYFCPICFKSLEITYINPKSKWAFLKSNNNEIHCIICSNTNKIIIHNTCNKDGCNNKVFYKNKNEIQCLTCGQFHK